MASPAGGTRCKESKRLSDFFNIYALLDITARFVDNLRTHIVRFTKIAEEGPKKGAGKELEKTWYTMDVEEGKSVMERIAAIKESSLQHSAPCKWGSLYHTDSLPVDTKTRVVPVQGPPRSFFGDILDKVHLILIEDTGNCQPTFSTQLGFGILDGFADYLFALVRHIVPGEEHLNKPTIRHPELSPSTIFVSESEISALSLNLEQTAILPFCVQADIYSAFRTTVTRVRRMSFVQLSPMTLTC
ncbi:hypothetical protein D8B26_007953 [Coccidioides posadasii str. Silveira]|uniref:Uncharacterized protein n=1 Tax=Coccidioides posadasii (strain RMSCC 757 / Silveira) TaxID=443226 RepID=E9D1U4_COCPS|nr:conserved hypothetical protein [Coccidioides posadasii str. Silveira]QVM13342.1 hypothetical protein D8B26_007953 [Coccidioides posadasii str. Silveira]